MPTTTFVSHGQNREDVVLWRALKHVANGRYVEIGGNDPDVYSITRGFYDLGWSGLVVEPEPEFADRQRAARPRDVLVQAAITSSPGPVVLQRFRGTGLSTLDAAIGQGHEAAGFEREELEVAGRRLDDVVVEHGFDDGDVHFMVVDVEGLEADVLSSVDLAAWRPWVLVIEATRPLAEETTHESWEPGVLAAGYEFCLFDGLSRFYVAKEHAELRDALSHGACIFDAYVDSDRLALETRAAALETQVVKWRRMALETWATASAERHMGAVEELERVEKRLAEVRSRVRELRGRNRSLRAERDKLEAEVGQLRRRQYTRRAVRAAVRRFW